MLLPVALVVLSVDIPVTVCHDVVGQVRFVGHAGPGAGLTGGRSSLGGSCPDFRGINLAHACGNRFIAHFIVARVQAITGERGGPG